MKFLSNLCAIAALALISAAPAFAQVPRNITMTVGVCDPVYPQRCAKPDTTGALPVTISGGSGTSSVNVAQVNGVTVSTGTGVVGTGTERVAVGRDTTTIAGAAPGTAGTASANVVTVQGIAAGTPLFVGGPGADGAAAVGNPLQGGGVDFNGATQAFAVNTVGGLAVSWRDGTAGSDGQGQISGPVTNGEQAMRPGSAATYAFNGASWDRTFTCNSSAVVNVTAGNTTEIVALSGSTVIRVCSVAISMSAAGTAQFIYGTGSNCAGSPANITGAIPLATGTPLAWGGGSGSIFRGAAANALCVAAVTGNVVGVISYARY